MILTYDPTIELERGSDNPVKGWFIFTCDFAAKDIAKGAGFWWTPTLKAWRTQDIEKAAALAEYADAPAAAQLNTFTDSLKASRATDNTSITIPCPEGEAYLPFQRGGIAFAMQRDAVLIADEMGLGKTIEAIGVINSMTAPKRVLIIGKASIKIQWKKELEKWLTHDLSVGIASGKDWPDTDVIITNYDMLHTHKTIIDATKWDVLVVDEVHYLKNPKARRTQMVLGDLTWKKENGEWVSESKFAPLDATKKIFLTGTPIVNRPVEAWPIIHYLDPITWRSKSHYQKRYCAAFDNGYGWDATGASNLDELQDKLRSTIMVRRLKADVLTELPAKNRQVIELPGNGVVVAEQKSLADRQELLADLLQAIENAEQDSKGYDEAVSALKAGKSADFTEISEIRHATALAKVDYVVEHIAEVIAGGNKVVVFAHHRDVIEAIAAPFGKEAVTMMGGDSLKKRDDAVQAFQNDADVKVFIGSIGAAGTGVDGLQNASQHVIFAELDWVPGNMSQAEDRLHRIGQQGSVLIQHLVLEGSLDAVMAQKIVAKQKVIDQALDTKTEAAVKADTPTVVKTVAETMENIPMDPRGPSKDEYGVSLKAKAATAPTMTSEQMNATLEAIQTVAGMCDGANDRDGTGFNRMDTGFGHSLARNSRLSAKQAVAGRRMVLKYRGQLSAELVEAMQR